ncbi:hydrolase [Yersinia rohdei]|nr:hydrolase [Yersinia rohdei]
MFNIITSVMIVIASLLTYSSAVEASQGVAKPASSPASIHSFSGGNEPEKLKKILGHYEQWEGVSYKLGGNNRKGIDCSAYIQRVFADEFSLNLPRSSHEQIKQGSQISKDALHTGDLVFFKTSQNTRHVGVYIGENKFIHASSSMGVTISTFDNKYWGPRYEQARRIHHAKASA